MRLGRFCSNAALADPRIKAVATSTMYDMTRVMAKGYNDSVGADDRYETKKKLAEQRSKMANQHILVR